jgi:hypothetical protein
VPAAFYREAGTLTCLPVRFSIPVGAPAVQSERRIIKQRARDALDARRAPGVRLGRLWTLQAELLERLTGDRRGDGDWWAIARALDAESVASPHGAAR